MSSFSSDRGGGSFDDQHNHESSSSFADEFHHQKRPLGGERHVPHAATTKNNKKRLFTLCLVASDCFLIGLQPILVHLTKNARGGFAYHPVSVNFITEATKVAFAIVFLMVQMRKPGEEARQLRSAKKARQAWRSNRLLVVPAGLYAVNNYIKFVMQLYFHPTTVKMLSNLKVLSIALLMKGFMGRVFSVLQWEALFLLILGITVNQLACTPLRGTKHGGLMDPPGDPRSFGCYFYTLCSIVVPSLASVYNEYALKKNFETSVHLQNLFMYLYGLMFNTIALIIVWMRNGFQDIGSLFAGHNSMTMLLVANNAAQGVLSSFFFKFADTILKKYSSTVATIFTGLVSAFLFGHQITINFCIGVSIVLISMHLFFSSNDQLSKAKLVGLNEDSLTNEERIRRNRFIVSPSMEHLSAYQSAQNLKDMNNGSHATHYQHASVAENRV
mmetsp:Transcript_1819/g.5512  ORF Transcript_1819/g.5512 Transcript_1819/m.5512 type:complete len:443 (-) Transcript_1819:66-1394(-)